MAKWTAQSWQLFFHVGMSILEYQVPTAACVLCGQSACAIGVVCGVRAHGGSRVCAQLLTEEPWYTDPRTSFVPCPAQQDTKYGLKVRARATPCRQAPLVTRAHAPAQVLYLTQLAVWCYTCFVHRFVDVRRKDYYVMCECIFVFVFVEG